MESPPCRYYRPSAVRNGIGELVKVEPKCSMPGSVMYGQLPFTRVITEEFFQHVCQDDGLAGKLCGHFRTLREREELSCSLTDFVDQLRTLVKDGDPSAMHAGILACALRGLANCASPYFAEPLDKDPQDEY